MFVEVPYSEGSMFCLVEDVIKTNRYFERPDSVKAIGAELERNFPSAEWEFLLAKARPFGVFANNSVVRATFPPSPGDKVYKATDENIEKFLGIQKDGLMLGALQFHNVNVSLNLSKLLQKHLAILAMSGAGKSHAVSVIFEELLNRKKEQGLISTIVFDVHGEYTSFGLPAKAPYKDFSSKTKIFDASTMKIACSNITQSFIHKISPEIKGPKLREFGSVVAKLSHEMRSGAGAFGLEELKAEVSSMKNQKNADAILSVISELDSLNLFAKVDSPSIYDLAKPGQLSVVDLSTVINAKRKQIIVDHFSSKLFNERRAKKIPPFSLFIEEAHNFIPESTGKEHAIARSILQTISREGRKFGASLVIISQRPKRLDTSTIANCNTNLIFRITNPNDLDHIKTSCEGLDSSTMGMVSSLRVGEAIIMGEAIGAPTFFKVRQKTSQPSKHETTMEEDAKNFQSQQEKINSEANTFL
jgi:DNA helicase HerA-like ATPase